LARVGTQRFIAIIFLAGNAQSQQLLGVNIIRSAYPLFMAIAVPKPRISRGVSVLSAAGSSQTGRSALRPATNLPSVSQADGIETEIVAEAADPP
jgi:hypothetical protein